MRRDQDGAGGELKAVFRFYEELNDFLPPERRRQEFTARCARAATTKHMIEALGVPHTEVELILVNGESAGFDRLLCEGDRVAVYPRFEALDITPMLRVRAAPLRVRRFVADVSIREARVLLTRDRELLKLRGITHGCYVHALKPALQFREIVERLDLRRSMKPFSLCLECNRPLRSIDKAAVLDRLPPTVRSTQEQFTACDACGRIYWRGSHWQRMRSLLDDAIQPDGPGAN